MRCLLPGQIFIPLIAAFMYALAAALLKRALQEGAGAWRVTFVSNLVMAVGYQACWLLRTQPFSGPGAARAGLAGCVFFAGQIFTFLAFNQGDVSVVTPILGTKVIWVALFSTLLIGHAHAPRVWIAVLTTALGTAVLGYQPGTRRRQVALSVALALCTSCSFGLTDVLVGKWAPLWGFGNFIPVMFLVVGVLSLGLIPFMRGPVWAPLWLGSGAVVLAAQALGMAYAITLYGHVTTVNIAYNSRGLWSVTLVWVFGHWIGNREREKGTGTMLRRMAGAGMLVAAIFIVAG